MSRRARPLCGGLVLGAILGMCAPLPAMAADDAASGPAPGVFSGGGPPLVALPSGQSSCGDVLAASGVRPSGLEFLFCRREGEGRTSRLVARYRVRGDRAADVETVLRERCGMAALERASGIWSLPAGGEGRLPACVFASADASRPSDSEAGAVVHMGEVPRPGVFAASRADWGRLDWFAVRVELPCAPRP